jgi:hypothetical protein
MQQLLSTMLRFLGKFLWEMHWAISALMSTMVATQKIIGWNMLCRIIATRFLPATDFKTILNTIQKKRKENGKKTTN